MIVLTLDKTIRSAWYFCEANIRLGRGEPETERRAFNKLILLAERELFERCKELFHRRYGTRKGGKESINPIGHGIHSWQGKEPDADVIELVDDLRAIMREFGKPFNWEIGELLLINIETEMKLRGSGLRDGDYESGFMDAARLTRIFLSDFLVFD
jgi:hypothetical protein